MSSPHLSARLGLWDAISIIVGIVVGTAIFKSPPFVFSNVGSSFEGLSLWLAGGALSLVGAWCYAELATTYPRSGGDYHYLTLAFGPFVGFLFGWAQLAVILTGSIGQMAYVFADYGRRLLGASESVTVPLALVAILGLTVANLYGVVAGKRIQNGLTLAKVLGLGGIVAAGLFGPAAIAESAAAGSDAAAPVDRGAGIGLALVFVLYAFGGWNDAAFVAAEVQQPQRNIPRALVLGILGITLLYLLVNLAYLHGLGFGGLRESGTPAADLLRQAFGARADAVMSVLVMISALGAIHGMIFTGSRVYARLGTDHPVFAWLGAWNDRWQSPRRSLAAQALVAAALVITVGTRRGQLAVDWVLSWVAWQLPWDRFAGGFEILVAGTAPVFWAFFFLTGVSLLVTRWRDRSTPRPFRVPWYPLPPLLFCGSCVYMFWSSLSYAGPLAVIGLFPLILGVPLYLLSRRQS